MKHTALIFLTFLPFIIMAQNGITFQVEELSSPEKLLAESSPREIYEHLIRKDQYYTTSENRDFPFNIIVQSNDSENLVSFGYHSFFTGMYQAYADHRPFVLSPDMIWLLISQGFARHVNANKEELRNHFVDFSGKISLIVKIDKRSYDDPEIRWEEIFPEFTKQIAGYTGNDLVELLSSNFSTTTAVEKIASEITVMEAMQPYFEFIVFYAVCGIPEITLKGTTEDWEKILEKTKQLSKYDLAWWTNELIPVLEEFVNASKGKINKPFWQNMFKYHSQKQYGAPKIIDGWIVKFFPYDKYGKRNDLQKLEGGNNLPDEIVKTDLKFIKVFDDKIFETSLELWAGFIGLKQNSKFALEPKIGWMIREKDVENIGLKQKLESKDNSYFGISIRVKEFPAELLSLNEIKEIEIEFLDEITIPDEFAKVKIKVLKLSGKIKDAEIERIKNLFPKSYIYINNEFVTGKE